MSLRNRILFVNSGRVDWPHDPKNWRNKLIFTFACVSTSALIYGCHEAYRFIPHSVPSLEPFLLICVSAVRSETLSNENWSLQTWAESIFEECFLDLFFSPNTVLLARIIKIKGRRSEFRRMAVHNRLFANLEPFRIENGNYIVKYSDVPRQKIILSLFIFQNGKWNKLTIPFHNYFNAFFQKESILQKKGHICKSSVRVFLSSVLLK